MSKGAPLASLLSALGPGWLPVSRAYLEHYLALDFSEIVREKGVGLRKLMSLYSEAPPSSEG